MILTAEADSLPTDAKELLHDNGLVGCHSSRSNDLSVHARIDSSGYIRLLGESDVDDRNGHAAIFEVKFGKKTNGATEASREGSDLGTSEDRFEPTASCINGTKKRQPVTRSGLSRLICCVCHLHHKWAMNSPAAVREFFGTMLQQVCHFKVDVMAGDANAGGYKSYKKQEYQDLYKTSVASMLREMQREVNVALPFANRLHIDCSTNNHPTQLRTANDIDCCFMAIVSWRKASRTQNYEKTLEQSYAGSVYEFT